MSTLQELRDQIEAEVDSIGVKSFSHNITSLCLMQINKGYGRNAANQAIRDFGLDDLGWHEVVEEVRELGGQREG